MKFPVRMVLGGAVEPYWGIKMGLWPLKLPSGMAYWCGRAFPGQLAKPNLIGGVTDSEVTMVYVCLCWNLELHTSPWSDLGTRPGHPNDALGRMI